MEVESIKIFLAAFSTSMIFDKLSDLILAQNNWERIFSILIIGINICTLFIVIRSCEYEED